MIDNATDSYRAWPTDRMELEHHFYQHFPYMMGVLKEKSEFNLSEALGYNLQADGSPITMRLSDANTPAEFLYMYDRNVSLILTKYAGVVTGKDGKLRKKFAREVAKQRNLAYSAFLTSTGKAEQAVQLGIRQAMEGRTVLVIAHRLATVQEADLIVLIEKGKICDYGTHNELIRKKGRYQELCEKQFIRQSNDA